MRLLLIKLESQVFRVRVVANPSLSSEQIELRSKRQKKKRKDAVILLAKSLLKLESQVLDIVIMSLALVAQLKYLHATVDYSGLKAIIIKLILHRHYAFNCYILLQLITLVKKVAVRISVVFS